MIFGEPDGMPVMGDEPDDLDAFIAEQGDDFRHELELAELRAEVARLTAERDQWVDQWVNQWVMADRAITGLRAKVARLTAELDRWKRKAARRSGNRY